MIRKTCLVCEKVFYCPPSEEIKRKTCSQKCRGQYLHLIKIDALCCDCKQRPRWKKRSYCLECNRRRHLETYYKHKTCPDAIRLTDKEKQEKKKIKRARHYAKHKGERKAQAKAYYEAHKDEQAFQSRTMRYRKKNAGKIRERTKEWQQANPDKVRLQRIVSNRRRRANGQSHITIKTLKTVLEREGSWCHICGKKVQKLEVTFDHIIPVSKGGDDNPTNLRIAHRGCNSRRNAGLIPAQMVLV